MNIEGMSLKVFLSNNNISEDDWEKAGIEFEDLKKIAIDHQVNIINLDTVAELLAKILQKCPHVHSVRWRVKDPEHLMEKIVRKRSAKSEKYLSIDTSNYMKIITDLVGVRILHLFKYEWKNIQDHILENWDPTEKAVAYIRAGDEGEIIESYKEYGCDVKDHPAGYRSIHYVISTKPTSREVFSELQVRTIFEEGWSEIDHEIRYPNFSNNKLISYFLTIFNRTAGSADEMGSFVRDLKDVLSLQEIEVASINDKQEKQLQKIEELVSKLDSERKENKTKDDKVDNLKAEIQKLRRNTYHNNVSELAGLLKGSYPEKVSPSVADRLRDELYPVDEYSLSSRWNDKLSVLDKLRLSNSRNEPLSVLDKFRSSVSSGAVNDGSIDVASTIFDKMKKYNKY